MSDFLRNLRDELAALGVRAGVAVMVHSDLQAAGFDRGSHNRLCLRLTPADLDKVIRDLIGSNGTQIVPAFSFSWTRGETYDSASSPSTLGGYSEYLCHQTGARRSSHPLTSVVAEGPHAERFLNVQDESSFGPGSVYAGFEQDNVLQLMIGTSRNSMNDYVQTTQPVPYRYPKFFFDPKPGCLGANAKTVCRHDVRFMAMGDRLHTAVEGLDEDLRSHVPQRWVGGLPVWAIETRALIRLMRTQLERNVFSYQIEPARVASIRRLALCHRHLEKQGMRFFAMNRAGTEKWLYTASQGKVHPVFVMDDAQAEEDASWLLNLADGTAGRENGEAWFMDALFGRLKSVCSADRNASLKEIALRVRTAWSL
jgi:hypothetical protein